MQDVTNKKKVQGSKLKGKKNDQVKKLSRQLKEIKWQGGIIPQRRKSNLRLSNCSLPSLAQPPGKMSSIKVNKHVPLF